MFKLVWHRCCASILGLAYLLLATAAAADQSPMQREIARTLMRDGDAKFARKDFKGGLRAYDEADRIMQVPTTGLAVAKTEVQLHL